MGGRPHGYCGTPTYSSWKSMRERVRSDLPTIAPYYKDKGITVCERWLNFLNFLSDMGPRPSLQYSLERIDGNLGYNKDNCKWATSSEQQSNKNFPLNTSGRIGVSKCHITGWWRVRLSVGKVRIWVGRFSDFDAACAAMEEAELRLLGYSRATGYTKKD